LITPHNKTEKHILAISIQISEPYSQIKDPRLPTLLIAGKSLDIYHWFPELHLS
jgi:hypothetical protein